MSKENLRLAILAALEANALPNADVATVTADLLCAMFTAAQAPVLAELQKQSELLTTLCRHHEDAAKLASVTIAKGITFPSRRTAPPMPDVPMEAPNPDATYTTTTISLVGGFSATHPRATQSPGE